MPPPLASLLTFGFLFFLFRRDIKQKPNVSAALWIPFCWVLIACSRDLSEWCRIFGIPTPGASLEGGSPIDRLLYIILIALGINVLRKRQLNLGQLARDNAWLAIFLAYCFLSILWSDYPFVSLKRWIKVLGHPVMALIILTEPDPKEALVRLINRCGYILVPVSVLYIKYYPHLGRGFSEWTGAAYNTGITSNKNALGINCLILGFIYFWSFLRILRMEKGKLRNEEIGLSLLFQYMNYWLLSMADSKTPLAGLIIGISIVLFASLPWIRPRAITPWFVGMAISFAVLQSTFGIYEAALQMLGRNASLTDRTELWKDVLQVDINPIIGTGFESFWLGSRLEHMWNLWAFRPNQAHNGYLETYLNLGLIGVLLMIAALLATYAKAIRTLPNDFDWGRLRLGLVVAVMIYNWTEAAFKTTHPIFFIFYIIAVDCYHRPQTWAGNTEASEKKDLNYDTQRATVNSL